MEEFLNIKLQAMNIQQHIKCQDARITGSNAAKAYLDKLEVARTSLQRRITILLIPIALWAGINFVKFLFS